VFSQDGMTPCWRCTTSIHPVHGFDDHECQACYRDRERRALPILKKRNLKRMLEKKLEVRKLRVGTRDVREFSATRARSTRIAAKRKQCFYLKPSSTSCTRLKRTSNLNLLLFFRKSPPPSAPLTSTTASSSLHPQGSRCCTGWCAGPRAA